MIFVIFNHSVVSTFFGLDFLQLVNVMIFSGIWFSKTSHCHQNLTKDNSNICAPNVLELIQTKVYYQKIHTQKKKNRKLRMKHDINFSQFSFTVLNHLSKYVRLFQYFRFYWIPQFVLASFQLSQKTVSYIFKAF